MTSSSPHVDPLHEQISALVEALSRYVPPESSKMAFNLLEASRATGLAVEHIESLIESRVLPARPVPGAGGHHRYIILRPDLEQWLVAESTAPRRSPSVKRQAIVPTRQPVWSMPNTADYWAKVFDVDRKTFTNWVDNDDLIARRMGKLFSVEVHEIPRPVEG